MPLRKFICDNCAQEFSLFLSYSEIFSSQSCPDCKNQAAQGSTAPAVTKQGTSNISKPN